MDGQVTAGGVFVNYRVGDLENEAAFIADALARRLGAERVFFASRSLRVGRDYTAGLRAAVERCQVFVAVIGPNWLTASDALGRRRIDSPDDWVRRELAAAFERSVTVIPVLIGDRDKVAMPEASALPEPIRGLATCHYLRMSYQDLGLDRLVAEVLRASPGLAVADLFAEPDALPRNPAPSALLRAEHAIVPFHGRQAELQALDRWCAHPAPLAVLVLTGPGGQGKTRLAQELCARYRERGWIAGSVAEHASDEVVARLSETETPILLVFDYAETRGPQVASAALALTGRDASSTRTGPGTRAPARLLLLTRAAGEWRQGLLAHRDERVAALFRSMSEQRLGPLTSGTYADRYGEFNRALAAFGRHLRMTAAEVMAPADLEHHRYTSALDIHAAALADLLDTADLEPREQAASRPDRDPVGRVLDHETRYWRRTLPGHGLDAGCRDLAPVVIALGTLFAPATIENARALLRRVELFADQPRVTVDRYLAWAASLYPGWGFLNPLRPDRLGEDQAAALLARWPDCATGPLPAAEPEQIRHLLTVLGRAAPRHAGMAEVLTALVRDDPRRLVPLGVHVAPQLPDPRPLANVLSAVLRERGDQETVADVLRNLPAESTALADLTVLATDLSLATADQHARINPGRTALLLYLHGRYLAAVGRRAEALEAARRAVDLFENLAAERPDSELPNLSTALLSLALRLSETGSPEAGLPMIERAVRIRRELAADDPQTYRPLLASCLVNLSDALAELGRSRDGLSVIEEALALYQALADEHPAAYLPDRAGVLVSLSNRYSELGLRQDELRTIRQAVAAYRGLSDEYPDVYLPTMATALTNLSSALGALGTHDEGLRAIEEACEIVQQLADRYPAAHRGKLASALINWSARLTALGRHEEAAARIGAAVELIRQSDAELPGSQDPVLVTALANHSAALGTIGRHAEGAECGRQAVAIARALVSRDARAHQPRLADALVLLANRLADTGRLAEALDALTEAVARYRELADERPDRYTVDLARALNNLSIRLHETGAADAALEVAREVVDIRRGRTDSDPAHRAELARALYNLSNRLDDAGQERESLAAVTEAVGTLRTLVDDQPDAFLPDLAAMSTVLGTRMAEQGSADQGLAPARQAVEILRTLAGRSDVYLPDLCQALHNLSLVQSEAGHAAAAMSTSGEAVDLRRRLAERDAGEYRASLANAVLAHALVAERAGQPGVAVTAAAEAVTRYEELAGREAGGRWVQAYRARLDYARTLLDRCRDAEAPTGGPPQATGEPRDTAP